MGHGQGTAARGKAVVVTGGSTGIGRGAVDAFAAEGAAVVIHGLDQASVESAVAEVAATGAKPLVRVAM